MRRGRRARENRKANKFGIRARVIRYKSNLHVISFRVLPRQSLGFISVSAKRLGACLSAYVCRW
jgi:hypothetical protein